MTENLQSFEPATGALLWEGLPGDVDAEVERAASAWPLWAAQPVTTRMEAMRRFANAVRGRDEALADRIARDEDVPGCVGTLMTNKAVEVALKERGVQFVRAKVGDRYVLEELEKHDWLIGGEGSGHLLALDKHTTGDGLISALQVLQACAMQGRTLAQLLEGVALCPQVLINVRLQAGQDWRHNTRLTDATRAVEAELGASGRVLIRASGTEPLLRVMVEAIDGVQAQRCAERLAAAAAG